MKDNTGNLSSLIRRALASQIDLGMGEAIVQRRKAAAELPVGQPEIRRVVSVMDLFQKPDPVSSVPHYPSLAAHFDAVCNCQECPLGQTRNKFVYGVGSAEADLMFIGEAPGADEDRLGEPFVGRAGQLLDKILTAMKLSRDQVYIANILKCRPPGNRDPQPDEMNKCFPHLKEQIRIIKPKIICALGRVAAQALLGTSTPLGKLRKRWHEYDGVPMLITYHPAALLRFPAYKKDTWEDMQMLMAHLEKLK